MTYKQLKYMSGDRKDLRKFGITIGVVFMMLGVLFFLKGGHNAVYLLFLGVVFTVLGVTVPLLLKPFYRIWMTAADMLGQLVTGSILLIWGFTLSKKVTGIIRSKKSW